MTPEEQRAFDIAYTQNVAAQIALARLLTKGQYLILYPERRYVSAERLITWAKDDVANGLVSLPEYAAPEAVVSIEDALNVLRDTGSVTLGSTK